MSESHIQTRRQYTPAYEYDGRIISLGHETAWLPGAVAEVERLRSPGDESEIFVAYRDIPEWQRVQLPNVSSND